MRFILGAHGGARGHNPYPAPKTDRLIVRKIRGNARPFVRHAEVSSACNTTPQPWQRTAAKLEKRERLGWNDRRLAREARKRDAIAAAMIGGDR